MRAALHSIAFGCLFAPVVRVQAFSPLQMTSRPSSSSRVPAAQRPKAKASPRFVQEGGGDDRSALECFVILDDDSDQPQVVCTADPDDYAWFNGIDRTNLIPTDPSYVAMCNDNDEVKKSAIVDCKKETSHRGFPEWEFQNVEGDETRSSSVLSWQ